MSNVQKGALDKFEKSLALKTNLVREIEDKTGPSLFSGKCMLLYNPAVYTRLIMICRLVARMEMTAKKEVKLKLGFRLIFQSFLRILIFVMNIILCKTNSPPFIVT